MNRSFQPPVVRTGLTASLVVAGVLSVCSALPAATAPKNLGSGLDVLVKAHVEASRAAANTKGGQARGVVSDLQRQAQSYTDMAIRESDGSVLVYIVLKDGADLNRTKGKVEAAKARVNSTTDKWRAGVIEAYVQVADVAAIAQMPGVSAVHLAFKPIVEIGAVTSAGVNFHRIDQVPQFDGTGITVGVMSDSYAKTTGVPATADVASGDLPGPGNPFGNLTPVEVLDDPIASGTDEGRGMAQIVHDTVPKARLGFATASTGQVSFANNIRALSGDPTAPNFRAGFAAQVVVDDLFYSDNPMFQDGLVGLAVDEVATTRGVAYFSSAGNRPATQGYFSTYRNIAANDNPLAGTNISLTGVDPALYAGGFHNFRTDGGRDIAQTIVAGGNITFQWDEPFDGPQPQGGPVFFTGTGSITAQQLTATVTTPALNVGTRYRANVTATSGDLDVIVTVTGPGGGVLVNQQDTTIDEEVFFVPTVAGAHTITVTRFAATLGDFQVALNEQPAANNVLTDYNLLFFNAAGALTGTAANDNAASNRPLELVAIPAGTTQLVISRRAIPAVGAQSTLVRYVVTGTAAVSEYFSYSTPIGFGHNHARNANSTAAYPFFRPFIPENFTSPGPTYIYFNAAGTRLPRVEIRQKPDIAAMDGANNTFFGGGDSSQDADTFANFFGTSAAAPQAAAIAALVLQAKGGPGSVTPSQMKRHLQNTASIHDLDPYFSRAQILTPNGGKLTITATADSSNTSTADTNVFTVDYVGPGAVSSISLDGRQASPTAGNATLGPVPGIVFDIRALAAGGTPFTLGALRGIAAGSITSSTADTPPAPSIAGAHFWVLNMNFAAGTMTGGKGFNFVIDRDDQRTASLTAPATAGGNSADELGAGVDVPSFTLANGGMQVTVNIEGGGTATGRFTNRIGKGYSTLDGFGLINAQSAATSALPAP